MSRLEEIGQTGDSRFLGDIIHEEEIAKYRLLNYIQNELKLRQNDFDEIKQFLDKKKIVYTLISPKDIFRIYEVYRGKTKGGHFILKLDNENVIETTCEEFIKLWNSKELDDDIDISILKSNIKKLDDYFENEILEKIKGLQVQGGLIERLHSQLRLLTMYDTFPNEKIDKEKLFKLIDYLPFVEMTTMEIKELKDYLVNSGCINKKNLKVKNTVYNYFIKIY